MKSNAAKFLTLVLLVSLVATSLGLARDGRHHRHEGRPARHEVRAYVQANVLPVLREQRQKLESQLAPADRAQLATYRTQLKALKEQSQALRRSFTPAAQPATAALPVLTDAQQQRAHELRSQARTVMLSVAQLAHKYEAPIAQLAQEVQPQKEKWATDIKAIVAKNATLEQQEKKATTDGRLRARADLRKVFKPAVFLLMDANAPAAGTGRGLGASSFYPNPATATSQLDYEVKQAGPVTVELLNSKGTKIRTLLPETVQEKGPHTQQLDLQDLPVGTYFYKITSKGSSETKRLVKE